MFSNLCGQQQSQAASGWTYSYFVLAQDFTLYVVKVSMYSLTSFRMASAYQTKFMQIKCWIKSFESSENNYKITDCILDFVLKCFDVS